MLFRSSPWISKAIETAQKKVEARNYDIRKQVVEFDDVMPGSAIST